MSAVLRTTKTARNTNRNKMNHLIDFDHSVNL